MVFVFTYAHVKYDLLHFPIENNVLYPYTGISSGMCVPCTWGTSPSSTPRVPQQCISSCSLLAALEIPAYSVIFSDHFTVITLRLAPLSVPLAKASSALLPGSWRRSAQTLSSFIGIVQKRELEIKEWRDFKVSEGNKYYKYGDFVVVALYHWWNLLCISSNTALFWGWWLFL